MTYDLAHLKSLYEKATPGPWKCWSREEKWLGRQHTVIAADADDLGRWSNTGISSLDREDAALIVELVNALPSILSDLERIPELERSIASYVEHHEDETTALKARIRSLEADRERGSAGMAEYANKWQAGCRRAEAAEVRLAEAEKVVKSARWADVVWMDWKTGERDDAAIDVALRSLNRALATYDATKGDNE